MTDMDKHLQEALADYRDAYAWTQRVDQDLTDAESLVYQLKGAHRDAYERLRKAEDLLTELARQDVPMAGPPPADLSAMLERNQVAINWETHIKLDGTPRDPDLKHFLKPDHNGDPSCLCGWNPSQIPKSQWPEDWDVTVGNAVRMVRKHIQAVEQLDESLKLADGGAVTLEPDFRSLVFGPPEYRDLENGDHG